MVTLPALAAGGGGVFAAGAAFSGAGGAVFGASAFAGAAVCGA
jgi:hypothetical protein